MNAIREKRGVALMGIVNTTPDSFYDGGRHVKPEAARRHVDRLLAEGADLLDIGGESTRPGAPSVPTDEQWRRIEPALDHALKSGAIVSVDTTLPELAERALARGAHIINDVSCLAEPELATVVARHGAVLLLMHSRGTMQSMPGFSIYPEDGYDHVVRDVKSEWQRARDRALAQGLEEDAVWFDPGLGFHKSAAQSLELLARLNELIQPGTLTAVGPSRKSFLATEDDPDVEQRLGGTIAACLCAVAKGAQLLRVHDVHPVAQALRIQRSLRAYGESEPLTPKSRSASRRLDA